MTDIREGRNLGRVSADLCERIGVFTLEELSIRGPVTVFLEARNGARAAVSLNLLWALTGAVFDIDWRDIPEAMKLQLLDELRQEEEQSQGPKPAV